MFKNLLKTALRNLARQKGYSIINVAGLALALACSLLIFLWVMHELSYDRFHTQIEHLFRIEQDQVYNGRIYHVTVTPYPMGPGVQEAIPEITETCRITYMPSLLLRHEDKAFFQNGFRVADPSIFTMFDFALESGDRLTALDDPHSLVLTREVAEKLFGSEDPVGRTVTLNNDRAFTVTGVLAELPDNSTLNFLGLVPFEYLWEIGEYSESWGGNSILTFVQLHPGADLAAVGEKITQLRQERMADRFDDPQQRAEYLARPPVQFMVAPMKDIHLHQYFGYGKPSGDIQYVYIFSVIASFVLLIACINFMNLSTARSAKRAREVGLRKVVGARRGHLIAQFYGESMATALLALLVALGLVALMLPAYNQLSGKTLGLSNLADARFVLGMAAITLLAGFISGSYPALFLSSFMPMRVLKGGLASARGKTFRRVLVVLQFSLSVFLIIGTAVVYRQVQFMRNKSLGYQQEHLVYMSLRGDTQERYGLLRAELLRRPEVKSVSASNHRPHMIGSNSGGVDWDGRPEDLRPLVSQSSVDFDYAKTMGIELAAGRDFSAAFPGDTANAFLVNEALARLMDKDIVVGERLQFMGVDGQIVGVMKDFHFQSVRYNVEPLAVLCYPPRVYFAMVRLDSGDLKASLDAVEATWKQVNPRYPFDYTFVDETVDRMYRADQRVGGLLRAFAVLAIAIASLGLLGLSAFTAEQRTKEIGVRKVLGASVPGIVLLLGREFARWVLLANLVACPLGFIVMRNWQGAYAYRAPISWEIFGLSALLSLAVAMVTVSYQSIRASLANPARSLKSE